jgi:hypothetical protein
MGIMGEAAPVAPVTEPPVVQTMPADAPEWAKGIEPEFMNDPIMKNVRDIPSLVKSYVHAQRLVGRDRVVVPTKDSKPEEFKSYFQKIGLPESIDKYEANIPEGALFSPEKLAVMKQAAYENNILPNQFSKMLELFNAEKTEVMSAHEQEEVARVSATQETLKKEWGEGYTKKINQANATLSHFGGPELMKYIHESPIGSDEKFIRLMANIGEKLKSEDTFNSEVVSRFGMTKEEAKTKMNRIYGDMGHPYFSSSHASHKDALAEMLKYQEILAE